MDMQGHWTRIGAATGASALGRAAAGVAIATEDQVDIRSGSDLAHPGRSIALTWVGATPAGHIAGLDQSSAGKLAFVKADGVYFQYGLADTAGNVTALVPAPPQSFAPLIAWLDDTRVVVLTMDSQQESRLAIVDPGARSIDSLPALIGVRCFALSSDRQTIAAATEDGLWVEPVSALRAKAAPQRAVTLADFTVTWGLALDVTGSSVFMLSGAEAADGSVTAIRELGYSKHGSTWTKILDSPAPFSQAIGQVYLSS